MSCRCLSTQTQSKSDVQAVEKSSVKEEKKNFSFVHNIFRGIVQGSQVFPFPNSLDEEQKQFIGELVDPVSKFFTEVNDPVKNDNEAKIDDKTLDALWELGGKLICLINILYDTLIFIFNF